MFIYVTSLIKNVVSSQTYKHKPTLLIVDVDLDVISECHTVNRSVIIVLV